MSYQQKFFVVFRILIIPAGFVTFFAFSNTIGLFIQVAIIPFLFLPELKFKTWEKELLAVYSVIYLGLGLSTLIVFSEATGLAEIYTLIIFWVSSWTNVVITEVVRRRNKWRYPIRLMLDFLRPK